MASVIALGGAERVRATKVWERHRRRGFIVIRSAEGAPATVESVRGLRPADAVTESPPHQQ